ncbi:hypothetical protein U1Q18_033981 [Sarracenia purpurea var. burkii]
MIVINVLPFYMFLQPRKTLSARRWQAAFSQDGHLDIAGVLRRIQRGVNFILYCLVGLDIVSMLLFLSFVAFYLL